MMTEADIEVLIIEREADYMPGRTRWHLRTVEGYREIGNTYKYHSNGLLNSLYYDWPKTYIETASFQKNGLMENYMYVFDVSDGYKSYYSHSWRPSGFTTATHWWIDRKDRYAANEYDKEGRIRVKRVYKDDGEKDYALVYWYGPPIPYTEDGFLKKGRI
jgi:hypothetical protein